MIERCVVERDELAEFWLPWCVHRERPEEYIRIDHEPGRRDEARQLRVADLAEKGVRAGLRAHPRDDGRSVFAAIEEFSVTAITEIPHPRSSKFLS
jgi:hypothetical protein